MLFLIPAAILQKQSKNTLSSALWSSSYLRKQSQGQFYRVINFKNPKTLGTGVVLRVAQMYVKWSAWFNNSCKCFYPSNIIHLKSFNVCIFVSRSWALPTCQSCNMVWTVPPRFSSSPAPQRTGMGWCAADPAARWGWSAQTGCWSGPTTWPADPCLPSAAGYPAKDTSIEFTVTRSLFTGVYTIMMSNIRLLLDLEGCVWFRCLPCTLKSLHWLRPE